jgi:hypothetical protein
MKPSQCAVSIFAEIPPAGGRPILWVSCGSSCVVPPGAGPHSGFKQRQPSREEVSPVEEFLERIGEEALHIIAHVVEHIIENFEDNN